MTTEERRLSLALWAVGAVFIFGVWPLIVIWPSGFRWEPHNHEYDQMMVGLFATLGIFLVRAAADPLRHLSLIRFGAWSSLVHGAIMLVHALADRGERWHLIGDVPALFVVAALIGAVTRHAVHASLRGEETRCRS